MTGITLIAAALALLGLLACLSGLKCLWHRRLVAGGLRSAGGTTLLVAGGLIGAVVLNLQTYSRLTDEQPVAEIELHRVGEQRFQATVRFPQGERPHVFDLRGDEWQIDARILRWRGWAALIGLDSRYRLERLSGRYSDVAQAGRQAPTVYDLSLDAGLDVWSVARRYRRWAPVVDAVYGTAAFVPMADDSHWRVSLGRDGLIIRPANVAAEQALMGW